MTETSTFDLSTLTDDQREAISKVGEFMQEYIPFNKFLGLEIVSVGRDTALLKIPFRESLWVIPSDEPFTEVFFHRFWMWQAGLCAGRG